MQAIGPPLAIFVDALSFLASALGVIAGRRPPGSAEDVPDSNPSVDARGSRLQGMAMLFSNPYLRALTVHAALYNLAAQVLALNLVLWMVQGRDVSTGAYGLALSAGGIGAVIGTMLALRLSTRIGFGRAFASCLLLSCLTPTLIATIPLSGSALAAVVAAILLVAGLGLGCANIYSVTLRQIVIPTGHRARAVGAYRQVMYGSIPIGTALAGGLGEALGTRAAVALGALGLGLSALPMFARRIRALPTPQAAIR